MDLKTPLYQKHVDAGGRMVSFAGYLLPVQYTGGILREHASVRKAVGLFDVSHMGELWLTGKDALANVNNLLTNRFDGMYDGQIRYSPMCYDDGGVVDDLLVYRCGETRYLLVVNAANKDKDRDWIAAHLFGEVTLEDASDRTAQLAIQGPHAPELMRALAEEADIPKKYYSFVEHAHVAGIPCMLSRTGYTGEQGYEVYCVSEDACALWDAIVHAGEPFALAHCGLGCRDTLRLEAGMPLYGHELSAQITPLEAGLNPFVKLDKPSFIGKEALLGTPARKRVGFILKDRGIAREGAKVFIGGAEAGVVTSGTSSPTLGRAIAMALVQDGLEGDAEIEVRGRMLQAEIVPLPFYKAAK